MNSPLVSILMPVYNTEKYLREAINSLLNQTFTDFEFVIINDGSSDNSEDIILSYHDPRIVYFKQENQGVARTLNNGLKICKGKYIRRHDADDISTPNSLKEQVEFIINHPEVGLISSRQVYITENGKISWNYGLPSDVFFGGEVFKYVKIEDITNISRSEIVHGTALFERELVINLGKYRPEFLTSEDNDLWARIFEHKKIVILNSKSYFQRLHNKSATKRYERTISFYQKLVGEFTTERSIKGSDVLMRGEPMPNPKVENIAESQKTNLTKKGKLYRSDILDYLYKIYINSMDYKLIFKSIRIVLKDGWKLKQTWKAIFFPILGKSIVKLGVRIKRIFK